MPNKEEKVDFGFQEVDAKDKQNLVYGVFESVASKYDIMNDFMSFGLHRLWKKTFISHMGICQGDSLLDLAAGSGDISFAFINKAREKKKNVSVTITDINENMLAVAKDRAVDSAVSTREGVEIDFNIVNAEEIPYPDNSFNFCTIAFGIRNVTDKAKALKEIHRVLKPGGKFQCLEFSHLDNDLMQKIYDQYSFNVIPKMGGVITGDEASYQYLVESIRKFPSAEEFQSMMDEAGFKRTSFEKLTHGVVAIHSGWKV